MCLDLSQKRMLASLIAMAIINLIANIPLFSGLSQTQHENLARICIKRSYKRGQTIFREGKPANGFYIIVSGRVKVFKLSSEGKEQILHIFGPGEVFGEVPVFAGQCFPAYAFALEETHVLFLSHNAFIDLIKEDPTLALNMLAVLSQRLREFTVLIENLSLKEVGSRLAAYLLYLNEQGNEKKELKLDITKTQLASLLGTIPETLSRTWTKMNKQGLIKTKGRRIKILDREALQKLARGR